MYAYPRHITERFLGVMRERPAVLPYIDMPLQHTHPWTLARMRRPHRDIDDLVGWMRDRVPGLVLRTTFIVGFPGETEAEFSHLLDSVRRLRFDRVGVFCYSDEEGTAAFAMPDRVPPREKDRRRQLLMAAAREVTAASNQRLVGQQLDVLIEGRPEDGSEWFAGRSYRDAPEVDGLVLVKADDAADRRHRAGQRRAGARLRFARIGLAVRRGRIAGGRRCCTPARTRGLTLAVAEGDTGGLVLEWLTAVPGSSSVVLGGVVAYHDRLKAELVLVDPEVLRQHGSVSQQVGRGDGGRRAAGDRGRRGLGRHGHRRPRWGYRDQARGLSLGGGGRPARRLESREQQWDGDRDHNRASSACAVLELLLEHLQK